MNKKHIKIVIREFRSDEALLTTTLESFKEDIENNRHKLNLWWGYEVEYFDGTDYYDSPCNYNSKSPRRIIDVNKKPIYAKWNVTHEGKKNIAKEVIDYIHDDFYGEGNIAHIR